jgi:hypothetical protein
MTAFRYLEVHDAPARRPIETGGLDLQSRRWLAKLKDHDVVNPGPPQAGMNAARDSKIAPKITAYSCIPDDSQPDRQTHGSGRLRTDFDGHEGPADLRKHTPADQAGTSNWS